jgi:hypothetical protein
MFLEAQTRSSLAVVDAPGKPSVHPFETWDGQGWHVMEAAGTKPVVLDGDALSRSGHPRTRMLGRARAKPPGEDR